jgi:hypothetical protein
VGDDNGELTYGEVIEARKATIKDEYTAEIEGYLRNVEVSGEDYSNGLLSDTFFERKDIPKKVSSILEEITNNTKIKLSEVN